MKIWHMGALKYENFKDSKFAFNVVFIYYVLSFVHWWLENGESHHEDKKQVGYNKLLVEISN
jgi:hypothetical protein